ncbi:MAG: T9SS type A sorting domain-containing protein, partial [Bacteroidales bacterium]
SVTVSLYSDPAVNIAASVNPICKGASTTLTASGASTYLWTGGLTINPRTVSPASTTTYTVTGTYTDGCTATKSKVVTVDSITAPNLGNDTSLCANFTINLNAGTGYSTYLWSTGANASSINVDSSTAHTGIGTIKVYVHVTNGACAITSDTINITFTVCSGVVEYSKNTSISVFPNPTTGMINIVVNGIEGIAVMNIYSLQGQEVLNKELIGNVKTELDLSTLAKGVYFIRITNEKANILSKLIIQ